jgi:hypothetical protein
LSLDATAATIVAAASLLAGGSPRVTITAPGHTPKINTHWNYTVHVTAGGKPVAAKISEAIVDPIGGEHAVEFGKSTKKITNWPIRGSFSDFIIWPTDARGIPLTLRITVQAGGARKVLAYHVTPT